MLDLKAIRENPQPFSIALKRRGILDDPIEKIIGLDRSWRQLKSSSDKLKSERNKISMEINAAKKAGQDISQFLSKTKELSMQIKSLDDQADALEKQMEEILLAIPNVPHQSVPDGKDEQDNVEVRRWGTPKRTSQDTKPHYQILPSLLDFERAAKMSGSRFSVLFGELARLEWAIAWYMLSKAKMNKYTEVLPPYIVNSKAMAGTGQLPKFASELYHLEGTDLWLIPTSEVALGNLHAGEVLDESELPKRYAALTPNFRKEAGNYQKDIKGYIRQHQFHKVELFKYCLPERSFDELESLVIDAESVLQGLGLPYRVCLLCAGELGFASAKTYDLEVWIPSQDRYREISSCSNCTDFQARRNNTKFRRDGKNEYVHMLNGSGLAVGRTLIAILENFQDEGGILIPKPLQDFMGTERISL
jgi:seryl-tRNA synthetase